ncbi:DUF488 family protein [Rhodococcus qingshengii]|uniref:DUF488 domain-containing protein n=1 Tax=Rhodococcus qingshengii TaxID=334542 RepID=UPI0022B431A7|nr:DUF488 domain-containing protein [Rhodococcus qingshengii]MCZ4618680.1 DUF488 domain-containing protein [Rhodococcus qingshengii]
MLLGQAHQLRGRRSFRGGLGPLLRHIFQCRHLGTSSPSIHSACRAKTPITKQSPKSRHNPQFGQEALDKSLTYRGIGYLRLEALGGLRPTVKNTVNGAWRNASFRGYADYMQTDAFSKAVDDLCEIAKDRVTVIMCAEAVPWRCHRSMIGDALLVRGYEVLDIMTLTSVKAHTLTSFAKVDGTSIWYPSTDLE